MKKRLTLLMTLLIALSFSSCDCFDCTNGGTFNVNPNALNYVSAGETHTVTVTSAFDWNLVSKPDWIIVADPQTGGFGSTIVNLTAEANPLSTERSGELVFVASNGARATVTVTQEALVIVLKINIPTDFSASGVVNVLDIADMKIAEICHEYITGINATSTVIYPVNASHKRTNTGWVANTGQVVTWDPVANTCTLASGTGPFTIAYYDTQNSVLTLTQPAGTLVDADQIPVKFTDVEETPYPLVKIGMQYWMRENLKTKKYANGTDIPTDQTRGQWASLTTGACCIYGYQNATDPAGASTLDTWGMLYNFYAGTENKLDHGDWTVPTQTQLETMNTYAPNGSLKATGTICWDEPNTGATNFTGFTMLGSGLRDAYHGSTGFGEQKVWGLIWSKTPSASGTAIALRAMSNDEEEVVLVNRAGITDGSSIRLVRETPL